jgi:archaellum component FlaC
MGDIKVDHGGKPKSLKNIKKKINNLDDKIKRMQSFKEFYNGK